MEIKKRLEKRIQINEITELSNLATEDSAVLQELYLCLSDVNERCSSNAAWILSHVDQEKNKWLEHHQQDLINMAMDDRNVTRHRLLLNILERQQFCDENIRTDFLDFCLYNMKSADNTPGVKSLLMKLAYKICRHYPELCEELYRELELMEPSLLEPSTKCCRNHIMKDLKKVVFTAQKNPESPF